MTTNLVQLIANIATGGRRPAKPRGSYGGPGRVIRDDHPMLLALRAHPSGLTQAQIAKLTGLSATAVNTAMRNAKRTGYTVVRHPLPITGRGHRTGLYQLVE